MKIKVASSSEPAWYRSTELRRPFVVAVGDFEAEMSRVAWCVSTEGRPLTRKGSKRLRQPIKAAAGTRTVSVLLRIHPSGV